MKYYKSFVRLLAFSYALGSCQCDNMIPPSGGYTAKIFYRNSKGEDLLNSSTIGHLDPYSIKIDGKFRYVSGEILPKGGYSAYYFGFTMWPPNENHIVSISGVFSDTIRCSYTDNVMNSCSYNKMAVPVKSNINEVIIEITK